MNNLEQLLPLFSEKLQKQIINELKKIKDPKGKRKHITKALKKVDKPDMNKFKLDKKNKADSFN